MGATFTLEGTGTGAVKAVQDLQKALEGVEKKADDAAKGNARLEAAALKMVKSAENPLDKYNRRIQELAQYVAAGAISQDKANQTAQRFYEILQRTDPQLKALAASELDAANKRAANQKKIEAAQAARLDGIKREHAEMEKAKRAIIAQGAAIKQSLETPTERYKRQVLELGAAFRKGAIDQETLVRGMRKLKGEMQPAEEAGQSMGRQIADSMSQAAMQMLALFSATRLALSALQALNAEREQAAEGLKGARFGRGSLAQLAATQDDPDAAMKKLQREADVLFAMGATETRNESGTLLFDLKSADLEKPDQILAARMQALGILPSAGGTAMGVSGLVTAFGRQETGSFSDIVDKALGAGKLAPGSIDQLIQEVGSKVGTSAAAIGASDEFAFALTAVLAKPSGSISEGGTLAGALTTAIEKEAFAEMPELKGMTGTEMIEHIASKKLDRAGLEKVLGGRKEAISAFRLASDNIELLKRTESDVFKADRENRAQSAIAAAESQVSITAPLNERISRNRLELQQEKEAQAKLLLDAIMNRRYEIERKASPGVLTEWTIGSSRASLEARRAMGESNIGLLEKALDIGFTAPDNREQANEILGRINENMERQNKLLEQQNNMMGGGGAPRPSGRQE